MARDVFIPADLPSGGRIAVAHQPGEERVYLVLFDPAGEPIAYAKLSPEIALQVSEDLSAETGRVLQDARKALN